MRFFAIPFLFLICACSNEQAKIAPPPPSMDSLPQESIEAIQLRIENVSLGKNNAWYILGETYLVHGWYDIASYCFHEGNLSNSTNARAFFLEGIALDLLGKPNEAIEKFKRSLSLNSTYGPTHWRIALLYLDMGNYDNATSYAEQAVKINPNGPYAIKALARIHLESGNPKLAVAVLSQYLRVAKQDRYAYLLMGKSLQQLNNPNAISFLAMGAGATQVWADQWSASTIAAGVGPQFERMRALALLEQKKPDVAKAIFQSLVTRYPHDDSYKLNLSIALRANGQLDESIELANTVSKNNPEDHLALKQSAVGLFERFKLLQSRDDLLQAIAQLDKAIFLTDTSEINYILRGQIHAVAGNKELAANDFEKASSIATWMPQLTLQSANLYKEIENYDKAIFLLEGMRETYINDVKSLILEASIYIEMKEKLKALELISKALKLAPKNSELHALMQQANAIPDR